MFRQLSRRLSAWAIPNLTFGLILCQMAVYAVNFFDPGVQQAIAFDRDKILSGEYWRLLTFLVMPPLGTNLLLTLFFWWCLWGFGSAVERAFGEPKFNLYLLLGYLANLVAGMLFPGSASNAYLFGTLFLAFATLYPDTDIQLYAIVPVKAKWLALLAWLGYAFAFAGGSAVQRAVVLASLANYLIFFSPRLFGRVAAAQRRKTFARKVETGRKGAFHICQVCGITDQTHPQMEFRYCSQCVGQRGYCSEHLRNHVHVVDAKAALRLPT